MSAVSGGVPAAENAFDLLQGTTVVEFGDDLAGTIAAYHLALLGATVYLLEPPEGCWLRRVGDLAPAPTASIHGPLFACFARGKRSVSRDRAFAAPGAAWSSIDLVIEPRSRDSVDRLANACKPAAGTAAGPLALSFAEDDGTRYMELSAQAAFGMSAYLGKQGEAPLRVGFEMVTYSAAVLGVQAVLAALPLKQEHGLGQRLRVPFSRVMANILNNVMAASVEPDQEAGFSRGWASAPYYGVVCAEGELEILFYGPGADEGWQRFCAAVGAPEVASDPRFATYAARVQYSGDLRAALQPALSQRARQPLLELLWDCGAMAVPRWGPAEAAASEQAQANNMILPRSTVDEFQLLASPWEVDGKRASLRSLPVLASDTASFCAQGQA